MDNMTPMEDFLRALDNCPPSAQATSTAGSRWVESTKADFAQSLGKLLVSRWDGDAFEALDGYVDARWDVKWEGWVSQEKADKAKAELAQALEPK